jgi:protein TonB
MLGNKFKGRFNPFGIEFGKIPENEHDLNSWKALSASKPAKRSAQSNLWNSHRKALELSFCGALIFVTGFLFLGRNISTNAKTLDIEPIELIVEKIPLTEQIKRPPAPQRPTIPIPSENEDIPEDLTIDATEFDLSDIPNPPVAPEVDETNYAFVEYDKEPVPIGGYGEITKRLIYPELALKAGMEAFVVVQVLINEQGTVEDVTIVKDSGTKAGFEEEAIRAIKSLKWKPAMQRDRPVKVAVNVPVRFNLKTASS